MKINSDGSFSYTWFEVEMIKILGPTDMQSAKMPHEMNYWHDIQGLKKLAQDEFLEDFFAKNYNK
jgi:hypothetical protein